MLLSSISYYYVYYTFFNNLRKNIATRISLVQAPHCGSTSPVTPGLNGRAGFRQIHFNLAGPGRSNSAHCESSAHWVNRHAPFA